MRCPHCGEQVKAGQERCFACGQKVKARAVAKKAPADPRIFIFAGGAVLIVAVGLVIMLTSKPKVKAEPKYKGRAAEVESLRAIAKADTTTPAPDPGRVGRVMDRFDKIALRFEAVKKQVVVGAPTPDQSRLMGQIDAQLRQGRTLAMELTGTVTPERERELDRAIGSAEREANSLVSALTRAPRNREPSGSGL